MAASLKGVGKASAAMVPHVSKDASAAPVNNKIEWPLTENENTPRILMMCSPKADDKAIRRIKQLGIKYVNASGMTAGWKESELRAEMEHVKSNGLIVINKMHSVDINTILGREGRDAEIAQFQESLRVARDQSLAYLSMICFQFFK